MRSALADAGLGIRDVDGEPAGDSELRQRFVEHQQLPQQSRMVGMPDNMCFGD